MELNFIHTKQYNIKKHNMQFTIIINSITKKEKKKRD